ncbi:hypothetical protein [Halocatena halophila]|uniref:hypothetical protein n=1 Tax=Halocatena halophila TaxID=2814576 RepID=UPI002ED02CD2
MINLPALFRRCRRFGLAVLVIVSAVALCTGVPISTVWGQELTPGDASSSAQETHTITIESTNGSVQYVLSASEWINSTENEGAAPQGTRLSGRVGSLPWNESTADASDTIEYRGYIETFQFNGDGIQVYLDGQQVDPEIISANHLEIRANNGTSGEAPVEYTVHVDGVLSAGESADEDDNIIDVISQNTTAVDGTVSDSSDTFYFTGAIQNRSVTQNGTLLVNGRTVSPSGSNSYPSTAPNGPQDTAGTVVSSNGENDPETPIRSSITPFSTHSATPMETVAPSHPPSNAEVTSTGPPSENTSALSLLGRLISGSVLAGVLLVLVWRYFPRQDRW